jgi:HAD superfamily hydrolase (TIGR01509 family)
MHPAAVVFDLDGLLVDTEPLYRSAYRWAAAQLGFELGEAVFPMLVGRSNAEAEQALVAHFGEAFRSEKFGPLWREEWARVANEEGIALKPHAGELVRALTASGVPCAVATSSDPREASLCLEVTGLRPQFPVVVTGADVEHAKPLPDLFLLAAERLEVPPARCVALEDSPAGVRAAHAAGMSVLWIPDLVAPDGEEKELATRILPSLAEATEILLDRPSTRLVVYGTLAPGEKNHHLLSTLPGEWRRVQVRGIKDEEGFGLTSGHPGLVWHPGTTTVDVWLLESEDLPGRWAGLDDFEGAEYRRILAPVEVDGRITCVANLYQVNRESRGETEDGLE